MMVATIIHELMPALKSVVILACTFGVIAWVSYCISSIARVANALERIADALEEDDEEKGDEK